MIRVQTESNQSREARSVFLDERALQFFDHEQAAEEDRFIMLRLSYTARILVVCHCEREQGRKIRIIPARRATARERRFYEAPKP